MPPKTATARKPRATTAPAAPIELAKGEQYAGITLRDGKPFHLVLLPGEATDVDHAAATAWANEQGGELPDRIDAIVLFRNKKALRLSGWWFWTSEPYASDSSYAWVQDFNYGDQNYGHVSGKCRARAVRRVPIQ